MIFAAKSRNVSKGCGSDRLAVAVDFSPRYQTTFGNALGKAKLCFAWWVGLREQSGQHMFALPPSWRLTGVEALSLRGRAAERVEAGEN